MRIRNVVSFSTLGAFVATLLMGCESTEVKLAPAPAPTPVPTQPVPKEMKKGGGSGSSGNLKKNPAADEGEAR
jgi:hypothetical protein